jgi:hypothetical protein
MLIANNTEESITAHLTWLIGAAVVGFLVPFLLAYLLALPRNLFVAGHTMIFGTFLFAYARRTKIRVWAFLLRHPLLGLLVAVIAGGFTVNFVLSQPGSPGVEGLALLFTIVWLGVVYGIMDGLLLTVMPVYAVWCIGARLGWMASWWGRITVGTLALVASLAVTAAYHLGFPEFQGPEVIQPVIGNGIFTLAFLLSGSPLAPLLAHVAMHIAAVVHAYGTSIPLPPHY